LKYCFFDFSFVPNLVYERIKGTSSENTTYLCYTVKTSFPSSWKLT